MRAAAIAIQEWWLFGSQFVDGDVTNLPIKKGPGHHGTAGDESRLGFKQRTWAYFKFGVFPDSNKWKNFKAEPWSAAFISFCMRASGAGPNFPYSVGHHFFVTRAMRNRLTGNTQNRIVAFDKSETVPAIGDLLWKGRKETANWTFDDLKQHVQQGGGSFRSHSDLVVHIDQDENALYAIGGNIRNRVLRLKTAVDDNGMLQSSRYAVVVKNNISEFAVV